MNHPTMDPLEARRLLAGPATAVSSDAGLPTRLGPLSLSINSSNVLVIDGTDGDDNIAVRSGPAGFYTVAVGAGDVWRDARAPFVSVPADKVSRILVSAGGGFDRVTLDAVTNDLTTTHQTEARSVVCGPTNELTESDPMAAALSGVYRGSTRKWLTRSADRIKTAQPKDARVVFVGDSMIDGFGTTGVKAWTQYFSTARPLNLGMSGNTTSEVLFRVRDQGLLDGLSPQVVVLCVGTNNVTLSDDDRLIAHGIGAVIDAVRQRLPHAKILLSSVLPRQSPSENAVVGKVNDRLAALADGGGLRFVDATPTLGGPRAAGQYFQETNIHLNADGYLAWAAVLKQALDGVLAP